MKRDKYFTKKSFKEWLVKQPDSREWNYGDITDCVGCSFLKETYNINPILGGWFYDAWTKDVFTSNKITEGNLPIWFISLMEKTRNYINGVNIIKATDLKLHIKTI